ncbi:hypothetical protein CU097_002542, partial [Rhizopus azygosporus]
MNNDRLKNPKDHFYQTPFKDWSTITILNSYLGTYKIQSLEEMCDLLMFDLQQKWSEISAAATTTPEGPVKFQN